jgi:cytochrome c oxidase subunit 3
MKSAQVFEQNRSKIHPYKLALWIGCASIVMMFAAWTSAYIVRQASGNWLEFKLPMVFFWNTAVIIISSITLQSAYYFFTKENEWLYKGLLVTSFLLGLLFVGLQYQGWVSLASIGVELTGNPSGSFIYVISGAHAAHVLGGIATLIVALIHAFALPFKVTDKRKLRFELVTHYWHFMALLWIYLLSFFITQQ